MSDEDRDIDVESDEDEIDDDDNASTTSANTQFMSQAEKRAHHNALERKRRDHIKESFHGLRDSVPSLQGDKVKSLKASRAQILKHATDYIQFMSKKNNAHQTDIDDLKHQNVQLEQQVAERSKQTVRSMEKAKVLGSFAAGESSESKTLSNGSAGSYHEDSDSDTSESEEEEEVPQSQRKKLKVTK